MKRRAVLVAAAGAVAAATAPAQLIEPRPMRIVIGAPPGGSQDGMARHIALRFAALTGDTVLVENRPGGNGLIAMEQVARSAPDGRTLLLAGFAVVLYPLLAPGGFVPLEQLQPVGQIATERVVLTVAAQSRVQTVQDLERLAAQQPAGLNCGAVFGQMGLSCDQLMARWAGRVVSVPYPGIAPAVQALVGGHIDLMFSTVEGVGAQLAAGRVRALAISRPTADPRVPAQLPRFAQLWPGFLSDSVSGLLAPAGTPLARVRELNQLLARVLAEPETQAHFARAGQEPLNGSVEDYQAALRTAAENYAALLKRMSAPRRS